MEVNDKPYNKYHTSKGNTRIQKTKNRHLVIVHKLRKKEQEWDNRFYLDDIPEYNFISDKYSKTYKGISMVKKIKKKHSAKKIPDNNHHLFLIPQKRTMNELLVKEDQSSKNLNSSFEKYDDNNIENALKLRKKTEESEHDDITWKNDLEKSLNDLWLINNIPQFHQEIFKQCLNMQYTKSCIDVLVKEINDLEDNKAHIQKAMKAAIARENCLKKLQDIIPEIGNIINDDNNNLTLANETLLEKCCELLSDLRILSLNTVENIIRWRDHLKYIYMITRNQIKRTQTLIIPFLFEDNNYLLKIKTDTNDLHTTPLAKYYNFSSKNDPFLIYPSKDMGNLSSNKFILYISNNLINRIKACELVLLEEAMHEKLKEKPIFDNNQIIHDTVHKSQTLHQTTKLNESEPHSLTVVEYPPQPETKLISPGFDKNKGYLVRTQPKTKNKMFLNSKEHSSMIQRPNTCKNDTENKKNADDYMKNTNDCMKSTNEADPKSRENNAKKQNQDHPSSVVTKKNFPSCSELKKFPMPKNRLQNLYKGESLAAALKKKRLESSPQQKARSHKENRASSTSQKAQETIQNPIKESSLQDKTENRDNETKKEADQPQLANIENNSTVNENQNIKNTRSYLIQPLQVDEDEIIPTMNTYFDKLDPIIKYSTLCDANLLLLKTNIGQQSRWFRLNFVDDTQEIGYGIVMVDNSHEKATRKVIILHFSVIKQEDYGKGLKEFIDYLWKYDPCKEIQISLFSSEDETKKHDFNQYVHSHYVNMGFESEETIIDQATEKKTSTYYTLKRPENLTYTGCDMLIEPISIKSVVLIGNIDQNPDKNKEVNTECNDTNHDEKFSQAYEIDNRYNIINCLLTHIDEKIDILADITNNSNGAIYTTFMTDDLLKACLLEKRVNISNITAHKFKNLHDMNASILDKMKDEKLIPYINPESITSATDIKMTVSLMDICYRWKSMNLSTHIIDDKKYKYMKINNNQDIMECQSTYLNTIIYSIPTNDRNVNIFIIDQSEIIKKVLDDKILLKDILKMIFDNKTKASNVFDNEIWMPTFKLNILNNDISELKTIFKPGEYALNQTLQNIYFNADPNILAGTLKLKPKTSSKIIENSFIMGILNDQIDMPLFAGLIQKANFSIIDE